MTHTLHRRGTEESLKNDYVLLVTAAAGINHVGSLDKLRQVLEVIWDVGPANVGSQHLGTILQGYSMEEIKAALNEVPRIRCSFPVKKKCVKLSSDYRNLTLECQSQWKGQPVISSK